MPIVKLGHTGLWVHDLARMRAFYEDVLGLTVTDEDSTLAMVFLSSRPDEEHHELVLQQGRTASDDARLVHQISWAVDDLSALRDVHGRLLVAGAPIEQTVTHGNAFGVYFFDPEGNRGEVYWPTGIDVRQPFRKAIDLTQEADAIMAEAARLLDDGSPIYQPPR